MKLSELVLCLVVTSFDAFGQFSLPKQPDTDSTVRKELYTFPVNPGSQGFLAGTMGELRSTHFHAGLDIRTHNMEGVPIRAAMRGYVSRVIVGTFGYGRVILVKHPNGQTTLYAHLSALKGTVSNFVRDEQYEQKSFDVDLTFRPDQFPVQPGDTIGFSGNTGGSNGPHLHFEIRDINNDALNPLKFNFPEIKDTYSPRVQKIALTTLDINSRINDSFGRFEFYVYKNGNSYSFRQPILATGDIGVEILAYDITDINNFRCGINYIEMFADSQRVFSQVIEKINFAETRDILAVLDFKALKTQGTYFNKLYVDDGNGLDYTKGSLAKGVIQVKEKDIPVKIVLKDTYGNSSQVNFALKATPASPTSRALGSATKQTEVDVQDNTLMITASCPQSLLVAYCKGERQEFQPAYHTNNGTVYLVDLRRTLPDSVTTCSGMIRLNFKDAIPSGTDYKFYDDLADLQFQSGTLYDTLFLAMVKRETDGKEVFSIGTPTTAINQSLAITLKPRLPHSMDQKSAVYSIHGKRYDYLGGTWVHNKISFVAQELGDFVILRDTTPPLISRLYLNGNGARFRIADALSGIAGFEATLNGQWLLMNYDYKSGILQSEKRIESQTLKGDFELNVTDQAGNKKTFKQKLP